MSTGKALVDIGFHFALPLGFLHKHGILFAQKSGFGISWLLATP